MDNLHKPEGKEGKGLEFGECACKDLATIFKPDSDFTGKFGFFAAMEFTEVAMHSHLCACGYKWWHSRQNVEQHHDDHAHECPKCGKTVTIVHGWDDPNDKNKTHHIHHDHYTTDKAA